MKNYYILKNLCKKIYLAGAGNFWYEEGEIGNDKSVKYVVLSTIMFFIYVFMTILEIIAVMFSDLPEDEKSDSVSFALSHTIVMIKMFSVMANRKLVKELNYKIVKICEAYEDEKRLAENYKVMKINVYAYVSAVYGSCACFVFEGIRKMQTGSHFITVVTYWPFFEDDSLSAVLFRFFTTWVLCVLMVPMIAIDSFVMVTLIMYKYKFITLRLYLENLRQEFDKNNYAANEESAAKKLQSGLIEGIVMHRDLIRLSNDIDRSFGTVMALQVCLSSGSAVSLLLQIALSKDLTFVAGMKIIFFVIALFFLLALFLCNAGEITYQASLLSDSIFYCGWHACPMGRDLRRLVLMACASAQRPLVMKAFKMLQLTYGTFLTVVRSTYSVFALFYAQNE
uniref:Odorant receptor n=1 Tax=Ctenopseustis obliquana TaxID=65030 RepID=A0A097IYH3_9NEOP|nr:olfactory receptor 9 [Ctenopseustis obliquana]